MRSAIIRDNIVVNVIVGSIPGSVECPPEVSIGWLYDGETFSAPPPEPEPVPESVGNDQARIALILTPAKDDQYPHLLAQAEAVFDALPEPNRSIAKARMEYAGSWRRESEWVAFAIDVLGLTDEEADDLFRLADQQ